MKERPILFSAPMVRALPEGSKTQTRRIAPLLIPGQKNYILTESAEEWEQKRAAQCPYGQPGDRLWVRESFDFLPAGGPDQPQACEIVYWATGSMEPRQAPCDYNPMLYGHEKMRPSIHMPRWASRILLEIVSVRVERLCDISEEDAYAEGCWALGDCECTAKRQYMRLWESINGPGSWDANPWVWVIEFKVVQP